eukprot:SAG22_NODE_2407_length_2605_cov_1.483639_2_plen_61_part_00
MQLNSDGCAMATSAAAVLAAVLACTTAAEEGGGGQYATRKFGTLPKHRLGDPTRFIFCYL